MRNCLIMGSGRSGTSTVAGLLSKSGYYMGDNLIPPREANPKGFFECADINLHSNEEILRAALPSMQDGTRWLAVLPLNTKFAVTPKAANTIVRMVGREPYCYKDPRFSFTLPAWTPYLRNTRFVCVFRHPSSTIKSIIKECATARYLRSVPMNHTIAENIWISVHQHILKNSQSGEWLFIHYPSLFEPSVLDKIAKFLDTSVDQSFPTKTLFRSQPEDNVSETALSIYSTLLGLCA